MLSMSFEVSKVVPFFETQSRLASRYCKNLAMVWGLFLRFISSNNKENYLPKPKACKQYLDLHQSSSKWKVVVIHVITVAVYTVFSIIATMKCYHNVNCWLKSRTYFCHRTNMHAANWKANLHTFATFTISHLHFQVWLYIGHPEVGSGSFKIGPISDSYLSTGPQNTIRYASGYTMDLNEIHLFTAPR